MSDSKSSKRVGEHQAEGGNRGTRLAFRQAELDSTYSPEERSSDLIKDSDMSGTDKPMVPITTSNDLLQLLIATNERLTLESRRREQEQQCEQERRREQEEAAAVRQRQQEEACPPNSLYAAGTCSVSHHKTP